MICISLEASVTAAKQVLCALSFVLDSLQTTNDCQGNAT